MNSTMRSPTFYQGIRTIIEALDSEMFKCKNSKKIVSKMIFNTEVQLTRIESDIYNSECFIIKCEDEMIEVDDYIAIDYRNAIVSMESMKALKNSLANELMYLISFRDVLSEKVVFMSTKKLALEALISDDFMRHDKYVRMSRRCCKQLTLNEAVRDSYAFKHKKLSAEYKRATAERDDLLEDVSSGVFVYPL